MVNEYLNKNNQNLVHYLSFFPSDCQMYCVCSFTVLVVYLKALASGPTNGLGREDPGLGLGL